MAIPDYQAFMLPLLRRLGDGKPHLLRDLVSILGDDLGVSQQERQTLLPSGKATVLYSRVGWARAYMKQAGLIDRPSRGTLVLSKLGLEVLASNPQTVDAKYLEKYPGFVEFRKRTGGAKRVDGALVMPELVDSAETPEEQMERLFQQRQAVVASELLERIAALSPAFFENLVLRLLVAMGYGGSFEEAQRVGRSGDGGIDGVINEDRLGLDAVYVQAKRWQGPVGRPELQQFAGSLDGAKATKGVFITTSSFGHNAVDYVASSPKRIVLIGGDRLAELMIKHKVGVTTDRIYDVPKVDDDFFEDSPSI